MVVLLIWQHIKIPIMAVPGIADTSSEFLGAGTRILVGSIRDGMTSKISFVDIKSFEIAANECRRSYCTILG